MKFIRIGKVIYNLSTIRKVKEVHWEENGVLDKIEIHYHLWTGATEKWQGSPVCDVIEGTKECTKFLDSLHIQE